MVTVKIIIMPENPLIYLVIFFWIGMDYPLTWPIIIRAGVWLAIFQVINSLVNLAIPSMRCFWVSGISFIRGSSHDFLNLCFSSEYIGVKALSFTRKQWRAKKAAPSGVGGINQKALGLQGCIDGRNHRGREEGEPGFGPVLL